MQDRFLLQYRIVKRLGSGAMGEVFLAEDTRLKRHVALKILMDDLCREREALARFQVEAEAAARLNHPGIATVYAVEETKGQYFIAMEYVTGKPLKDLIAAGGLDLSTFFKYFIPLCEALTHAHENGIIHRDIKPGNIVVTQEGAPKLLDFGLARIQRGPQSTEPGLTQVGTIMGSPAYMSPEQALGHSLDHRSDLFSLGVVMREALTGKRPFQGGNFQEILASLTRDEPEAVETLRPDTPPLLAYLIKKCLEKNPNRRYQTARDILNDLRSAAAQKSAKIVPSPLQRPAANHRRILAVVCMAVILILSLTLSAWLLYRTQRSPAVATGRIFRIPIAGVDSSYSGGGAAISPNGRMIAYVQEETLRVMDLETGEEWGIPDAKTVEQQPFWSQDSRFVGYITDMGRYIRKTPPKGGGSALICNVPGWGFAGAATWGGEGKIIFDVWGGDWTKAIGLMRVSQDGGSPEHIPELGKKEEVSRQAPCFLPDGKTLLYVTVGANGSSELMIRSKGINRSLMRYEGESIFNPVYSPSGHILYQRGLAGNYAIWALPFDIHSLKATGEAFLAAAKGVWPSCATDGTFVYLEVPAINQEIVWVDRQGKVLSPIGKELAATQIGGVTLSPNGGLIAVDAFEKSYEDIWIMDTQRGVRTRLTFSKARDAEAAWANEKELVFTSERQGSSEIFRQRLDPGATAKLLVTGAAANPNCSTIASAIAFDMISPQTRRDLYYRHFSSKVPTDNAQPVVFLKTPFDEAMPQISPDGRSLAFMSNQSGRWEVLVRPFPKGEGEWQVSVEGGGYPRWGTKGHELFFATQKGLMSAKVSTRTKFATKLPQKLFDWKHLGLYLVRRYDVSPDGRQFAVVRETGAAKHTLVIAQNWQEKK